MCKYKIKYDIVNDIIKRIKIMFMLVKVDIRHFFRFLWELGLGCRQMPVI